MSTIYDDAWWDDPRLEDPKLQLAIERDASRDVYRIVAQRPRVEDMQGAEKATITDSLFLVHVWHEWRVNASLARCRHEPETIDAAKQIKTIDSAIDAAIAAFDAAWAEAGQGPACKNHRWSNTDHCCRCRECGKPLNGSDPTD